VGQSKPPRPALGSYAEITYLLTTYQLVGMIAVMSKKTGENARDTLIDVGTDLMRRSGYVGTTVDEICTAAGLTKGAFFHYFPSKEALAQECLRKWQEQMATLHRTAPYQAIDDPLEKVLASIDFIAELFRRPDVQKSCLAGTTVQEISETNPVLRDAAQTCFVQGEAYFKSLLDDAVNGGAGRGCGVPLDTASLARHWMATMQGSLLLWKASRDPEDISASLMHLKAYLAGLLRESV